MGYRELLTQAHEAAQMALTAFEAEDNVKGDELMVKAAELKDKGLKLKAAEELAAETEPPKGVPIPEEKQEAKAGYVTEDNKPEGYPEPSFRDWLIRVRFGDKKGIKALYGDCYDAEAFKGVQFGPEYKDLVEGTGSAGGFLVPQQFMAQLLAVVAEDAVVRPRAWKVPMRSNSLLIPALDQGDTPAAAGKTDVFGGVHAYWTEEAAAKTETEPDFEQIELKAYKLAGYTEVSDELMADSAIGLAELLRRLFGGIIAWREDYAFLRGTGVGQPLGILNSAALLTVNRVTANRVQLDDLARMSREFLASSWGKGAWYINPECLPQIVQLVDAGNNVVWIPNARDDFPVSIFGMPVYWTEKLPALGTTGDVLLADMKYYIIGDRQSTSIASSEHYRFIYDRTVWRFVHRVDGQPWISRPIYRDTTNQHSPFVALHTNTT